MKPDFSHPLKSPLARRLIIAMVLFSAVATLLMTAFQTWIEYRNDRVSLDRQLRQIGEVHRATLSQSLWATSDKEIRLELEGILRMPHIVHAAVHEAGKVYVEVGRGNAANRTIERRYLLRIEHQGRLLDIGTFTVVATLENIHAQLLNDAIGILAGNALLTFLAALLIFVLFQRLVTRHLATVAEYLGRIDPEARTQPLALARPLSVRPDELDVLVAAANDMQVKTRAALGALVDSEARVRLLLDSTSEAIFGVDTKGICTFANPACVRMLRYASEDDLVGKCIHDLIHHTHPDGRPYPMQECGVRLATIAGQPYHRNDEVHWRADGTCFPVEYWSHPMYKDGALVGSVVAFIDITERKQAQEELHRLAYYDSLTSLPNRVLFNDRLHQALADARRRQRLVALMLLDMDRFKVVNDTMGHEAGDTLLEEIGSRLQRVIRDGDTVSRLGGDEFALLFADVGAAQDVAQLAQNVLSQFVAPVVVGGREIFSSASIGIALFPEDTDDADSLLKFADSAMYHAKESGRSNYQFYSQEMTASVQARLRLETDLRRALDNGELFLHYQPQVDAAHNRITGVEALLRWRDPSGELISPAQFIPLAEETGLIVPIGRWVLETACAQLRRWRDAGHVELSLSVNVASRQFRDLMFPGTVGDAVAAAGIPPQLLELELTESILLEHSDDTRRTLDALKQLGVTLAIDDFGTGYSSLSYLKRLPIDRVKIDQSFVRDLASDTDDLAIVRAIISLARAMRLGVIAEGVETAEQLALLRREDCHDYQGYLFAHPLDAGDVERMLPPREADG